MNFISYWTIALLIKLFLGSTLPLSSDEAYYWMWSRHLDWSYFDHPGMIAWLIRLGHWGDPLTLRWGPVIVGHFSWWVWHWFIKDKMSEDKMKFFFLLMFLNPLSGWGQVLAIPDTPATLLFSLSAVAGYLFIEQPNRRTSWAILLGLSLGLGFNTKYHVVLFVPAFLIWLYWTKRLSIIFSKYLLLVALSGFVVVLPVLIWNYMNNWDSFLFQINHGLRTEKWEWIWPWEYLLGQILLIFPTLAWLSVQKPKNNFGKWLYCLGWFPVVFFFITSFKARPEGNWPILGYAPLLLLATMACQSMKTLKITATAWLIGWILVLSEYQWNWFPMSDKSNLKTFEHLRFDEFIPYLDSEIPVYASSFQMAATLEYKTRKNVPKLATLSRHDTYDYWPESAPPVSGRFIVLAPRETDFSETVLSRYKFIEENHFSSNNKIMVFETP